jgi:hypothetical protein
MKLTVRVKLLFSPLFMLSIHMLEKATFYHLRLKPLLIVAMVFVTLIAGGRAAHAEVVDEGDLYVSAINLGNVLAWFKIPWRTPGPSKASMQATLATSCSLFNQALGLTGRNQVQLPTFFWTDVGTWEQKLTLMLSRKMEMTDPGPPNLVWKIGLRAGQGSMYQTWGRNERILQILWQEVAQLLQRTDLKEIIPVNRNTLHQTGATMRTLAPRQAATLFWNVADPILQSL